MKKALHLILLLNLLFYSAYGEGRTSYKNIIKFGVMRERHLVDGESCIRVYLKPLKPEIKVTDVKIHIARGETVLKEIPIHTRTNYKKYPWEIFLPVDKKYTENDSELVNNLEPGSLELGFGYGVTKDGKILND